MKKKAWFVVGASVVAVGLVGVISLVACGRHFAGKERADFFLKSMDKQAEALHLTPEQQTYYDQMRADMKSDMEAMKKLRMESVQKVRAELGAPSPDMTKVSELVKGGMESHPKMFEKQIDRLTGFYKQLNADQQLEVRKFIEKRLSRFDS